MKIHSKLHNPIIALNSQLENAVIEKINTENETNLLTSNAEEGRLWYNEESGTFKFVNIAKGGDDTVYLDEFLSRTDLRKQFINSKVSFKDTLTILNSDGNDNFKLDSENKSLIIDNSVLVDITTDKIQNNVSEFISSITSQLNITDGINDKFTFNMEDDFLKINTSLLDVISNTTQFKSTTLFKISDSNDTDKLVLDNINNILTSTYTSLGLNNISSLIITDNNDIEKIKLNTQDDVLNYDIKTIINNSEIITNNISSVYKITDGTDDKFIIDNSDLSNTLMTINNVYTTLNVGKMFKITDGNDDKIVADNNNNEFTVEYDKIITNGKTININTSENIMVVNNNNETKALFNNTQDELTFSYNNIMLNGPTNIKGDTIIEGDLTVTGSSTKIDIESEELKIADNIIVLNSNMTEDQDPTDPSLTEHDLHAGIDIFRGLANEKDNNDNPISLSIFKWVEDTDNRDINAAVAKVSIYNNDNNVYELHQILEKYTLGRQVVDESGTSYIGYDGHEGTHYTENKDSNDDNLNKYSYYVESDTAKITFDNIVDEIDEIKYNNYNRIRMGETDTAATLFTIEHGLDSLYVDVKIQTLNDDDGYWYYDVLPTQITDNNTIKIQLTESQKIRYVITAFVGQPATNITLE